jgi:hypothetical protein
MAAARFFAGWMSFCVLLAIVGCQSIIGIEDRFYDASPPPPSKPAASAQCETYCNDIMSVCIGNNAVYATMEACLGVCALLPPGDPSEPGRDNTVACRQTQIANAQLGELSLNCPRAGPGGDGYCADNCDSYCLLFEKACKDVFKPLPNCKQACGVLKNRGMFDVIDDHGGDTLQCRLTHVSNAAAEPTEHCPHARIVPVTDPCINSPKAAPSCEDYCRINIGICTGAQAVYESVEQCMAVCAVLPQGTEADTATDTVGCRKYHSYNSVGDPVTHCPHAGPGGDGHCGKDNCTGYCSMIAAGCKTDFMSTFGGDMATCLSMCATIPGAGPNSGYSIHAANGNTLQCRLLHAARALADSTACPSAMGAGDCQ